MDRINHEFAYPRTKEIPSRRTLDEFGRYRVFVPEDSHEDNEYIIEFTGQSLAKVIRLEEYREQRRL